MKKLLILILGLWSFAYGQTVQQFRYDTTKFLKVGGRNHVMIENLIQVTDSTYKALVMGSDGVIKKITYWPGSGSGGGDTRYVTPQYGMLSDSTTTPGLYRLSVDTVSSTGLVSKTRLTNQLATKQGVLTLTTTGSSGPSNLDPVTGVLNIPNYAGGGGGGRPITEGFAIDVDSSGGVYNIKADTNLLFQTKDSAMKLRNSDILPGYKAFKVYPQVLGNYEAPMEFLNIGNHSDPSNLNHTVKTGVLKNNWALANTFNMVYDLANAKWNSPVTSVPSMCLETGVEGITLHAVPAGTNFSDTWHVLFQSRPEGPTGVSGGSIGIKQVNQSKTTMYWKYDTASVFTTNQHPWVGGTAAGNNPFIWMHTETPKGTFNEFIRSESNTNFATGGVMNFRKSRGTYQTKLTSNAGDFPGLITFGAYDGANYQRTARIASVTDAAATAGVAPQSLLFQTSSTDSAAIATRLRVWGNGQISMGANTVNSSAALDIQSIDKGALLPRLNSAAVAAIASPASGLIVYNTDTAAYFYYDGAAWAKFSVGGGGGGTGVTGGAQSFSGNKTWSGITTFSNAANVTYAPQIDQVPAFKITTTLPGGTVSSTNAAFEVAATSINQTSGAYGANVNLLAGATDAMFYSAGRFNNAVAGTGTTGISTWAGVGNKGVIGISSATTTGFNAGGAFDARGGNVNAGVQGFAQTTKNSATNIGVLGYGINAGTSPIQVGGYFGLHSTAPTFVSAGMIADNGAIAAPIAIFRDNGTAVLTIADGGNPTLALGNKLMITTGSNASVGTATLIAGTVTVATTAAATASKIFVTVTTPGGTQGFLSVPTIVNGTSFTITSTSAAETSLVNWWIIN